MKISQADIRTRFKSKGLRVTPQRATIYQTLTETTTHPTAEDLFRQVKRIHPMISQNTVYYTLSVLRQAGLVNEVNYWHDGARFDANVSPHHHLICLGCRSLNDLEDHMLDGLALSPGIPDNFLVTGHQVEFHGYCSTCQKLRKHTHIR